MYHPARHPASLPRGAPSLPAFPAAGEYPAEDADLRIGRGLRKSIPECKTGHDSPHEASFTKVIDYFGMFVKIKGYVKRVC